MQLDSISDDKKAKLMINERCNRLAEFKYELL